MTALPKQPGPGLRHRPNENERDSMARLLVYYAHPGASSLERQSANGQGCEGG